jgi:hypothetical protein
MKKAGMSNSVFIASSGSGWQYRFHVIVQSVSCPAGLDNTHAGPLVVLWQRELM